MKTKLKGKVLAILMSLAMAFVIVPMTAESAYAESDIFVGDLSYHLYDDGTAVCTGYYSAGNYPADVTVPSEIVYGNNTYQVTSISERAFQFKAGLKSIAISNGVTSIGAFAFQDCTNLTTADLPSSLTSMGEYAFSRCTNLKTVNLPSNMTGIADGAFTMCVNLTSVEIPSNVKRLGQYAFSNTGLTTVTMSENGALNSIAGAAFYNCSKLKQIEIPSGVTEIGNSVFASCFNLDTVYYMGTKSQWDGMPKRHVVWKGSDDDRIKVVFLAGVAEDPEGKTLLIYNGKEQTGVAPGGGYRLSGTTSATEAGDYVATATLVDGLTWSDGTTAPIAIPWKIRHMATEPTGKDLTYNGRKQKGVDSGEGYILSGEISAVKPGTYTVTATLNEGYVWSDESTLDKTITWTITRTPGKALKEISCDYLKGAQAENVYFGSYPQSRITDTTGLKEGVDYVTYKEKSYRKEPIKWRIIYDKGKNYWLLADNLLDNRQYNEAREEVTWEACSLRTWLNETFYNQAFTEKEKPHIAETEVAENVQDKLFPLSMGEVREKAYGFENTYGALDSRIAQTTDYYEAIRNASEPQEVEPWWLRNPGVDENDANVVDKKKASYVDKSGGLQNKYGYVDLKSLAVRPSTKLVGASVLFQSLAEGGKAGETGKIKAVGESTTCNDWRLTLLDSERTTGENRFKAEESYLTDDDTRRVYYSGAKTGENEYFSVIIRDLKTGTVTHYGRVKALTGTGDAEGWITIDLTGIDTTGKRIDVFNEHYDPKEAVDYASKFMPLKTKIAVPTGKNLTYSGKAQKGVADGTGYTLSGASATNAGTYKATATLQEGYVWGDRSTEAKTITWTINKAANPLTIKAKTATVKGSTKGKKGKLKKTKTLGVTKVIAFTKKGQGKMTYTKASGSKKITINKTTGKVTVKKGLKKGTYKVKVKVKAAGNANYNASAVKTVTFKIKVK